MEIPSPPSGPPNGQFAHAADSDSTSSAHQGFAPCAAAASPESATIAKDIAGSAYQAALDNDGDGDDGDGKGSNGYGDGGGNANNESGNDDNLMN